VRGGLCVFLVVAENNILRPKSGRVCSTVCSVSFWSSNPRKAKQRVEEKEKKEREGKKEKEDNGKDKFICQVLLLDFLAFRSLVLALSIFRLSALFFLCVLMRVLFPMQENEEIETKNI